MKKLFSIIAILAMALSISTTTSFAEEPKHEESLAVAVDANLVGVVDANFADVCNFMFTNANSGMNMVDGKKVITDTGAATGSSVVVSEANLNSTAVLMTDTGDGPEALNYEKTGKKFESTGLGEGDLAVAVDLNGAFVINFNMGDVHNMVMTGANSGLNFTTGKKTDSNTGDAGAYTTVTTTLNSNSTLVSVSDEESGPQATNWKEVGKKKDCGQPNPCLDSLDHEEGDLALAIDANLGAVVNFNGGAVINGVFTSANTGVNDTFGKKNSKSDTGAATAVTGVTTNLNSNETAVLVSDEGKGPVALNSEVYKKNKPHHSGESVAIAGDLNVAVVANLNGGVVVNMVGTNANSGFNDTGKGNSTTGSAYAATSVTNNVNANDTLVSITDTGSGAQAYNQSTDKKDQQAGSPCDPQNPCGPTDGTSAANVGTSGTAVAVDATAAVVVNVNTADVVNMTNTSANTGGNDTGVQPQNSCGNSGSSTTDTGAATASTNVSNTTNTNTTLVVINK